MVKSANNIKHRIFRIGESLVKPKTNIHINMALLFIFLFFWIFYPVPNCVAAPTAKNVIVLIADGCASEQYTFARWFKGESLCLDAIQVGAVKTHIADSVVADSAPAASAFATGIRTSDKFISVGPHGNTISTVPVPPENVRFRPMATVLEGAKCSKKSTGLVSTSRVSHATPAAYASHVPVRDLEEDIMEQMVYQNIDVVFGGGRRFLLPQGEGGKRRDGENLEAVLKNQGYQVIGTRDELKTLKNSKVFGLFSDSHMAAEIDRSESAPKQPSISEMTRKAIDILSQDPDGFFLMVEGSQIDWACHANDPAHLVHDLLAFDKAVAVALNFAQKNGKTLVLALSDHNTGGFSIGNYRTSSTYSRMTPEALLEPFRNMKTSAHSLWKMIEADETEQKIKEVVRSSWGLDITRTDAEQLLALARRYKAYHTPHYAFGEYLCARYTTVGWSTHGHTGGDVPLFAYGPGSPKGVVDGPDIADICARAMDFNLADINKRLFVEATEALPESLVRVDGEETANPVIVIERHGRRFELPVNKNVVIVDGTRQSLEGVVIYSSRTKKVYVPLEVINAITGKKENKVKWKKAA